MRLNRLELKHRASADYRIVNVKIRILRRRCDKRDPAVLNEFQKRLLLLFVQVLYLVKVKQYPVYAAESLRLSDYLLDVRDRSGRAVELVQLHIRAACDKPCDSGLAHSRRTVKNHIWYAPALDYPAQRHILTHKMLLSDNVFKHLRSYPFSKWCSHTSNAAKAALLPSSVVKHALYPVKVELVSFAVYLHQQIFLCHQNSVLRLGVLRPDKALEDYQL